MTLSDSQLLDSLPREFDGPSAWRGSEMRSARSTKRWLYELSRQDIDELEHAVRHFRKCDLDVALITSDVFPLDKFAQHLAVLRNELLHGIGFQLLRGLPVSRYSPQHIATIFCGIGAHLGVARSQNAAGHLLGHVRDIGANSNDPKSRIYQTAARQTFHTDSSDAVGLLCLQAAREGGRSLLVSVESIYNQMRAHYPDLLTRLFDPIATDRRGEVPDGEKPFFLIPVLNWYAGFLSVIYQRQYINSAQRFSDAPRLTAKQIEALDKFDALANDPDLYLEMDMIPGDMQFVYNHSQLHDRTAFVDWPEPSKQRHLLRLWLSLDGDRPLPPVFKSRYGSIEIGNRGGIITDGTRLHVPL